MSSLRPRIRVCRAVLATTFYSRRSIRLLWLLNPGLFGNDSVFSIR